MRFYALLILGLVILLSWRFGNDLEIGEELLGGNGTIFNKSQDAFGFQHPNLNEDEGLAFFTGNSLFNKNWVTAPASAAARDGLGPLFNARSCSSCHLKDGRGRPPLSDGERGHGLLLRIAAGNDPNTGPIPDKFYGGQIQDRAIQGLTPEADFKITYDSIHGNYSDGTSYTLQKPNYDIINTKEGSLATNTLISPRVANQIIGMGQLEAITETTLLSFADEEDMNGDGISGRPNYVHNIETQSTSIGRFGWKASQPTVNQQVAAAFAGDMGITSSLFPQENCPPSVNCNDMPHGGSPEISDEDLAKVALYSRSLAVPARRDWKNKDVKAGKKLFADANCSSCHIPKIITGDYAEFPVFSNQTIRPYTDLLLHDMGEALADNVEDYLANGREWRTPPLWGIGLIKTVNEHTFYLHDGRARNLEEAILWHGGEAEAAKNTFINMNKKERGQLIKFLESL